MAVTSVFEAATEPSDTTALDERSRSSRSVSSALSTFRHGRGDPTTRLVADSHGGRFVRATFTPDGPGTLRLTWRADTDRTTSIDADAWGPGAEWLLARADDLAGGSDTGAEWLVDAPHPPVASAAREHRHLRFGRSGDLYHELLPTILAQRITAGEAVRQWSRLCRSIGSPAPGPIEDLFLPPAPEVLRTQPTWWFHPLGIERRRAAALVEVARHPVALWDWARSSPEVAGDRLRQLRGIGVWTVGSVLGPALGDPDALCVGDYHAKHLVAWALHRRPRGTDEEMVASLEPYRGQRGRVLRLLGAAGDRPPKFGPRQRILPMARW